jgi:hypothetical protein
MASVPIIDHFKIKRNSTRPYLRIRVTNKDDNSLFDFTGALGVTFSMKDSEGGLKVSEKTAVIASPATSGILEYHWSSEDVDTEGEYVGEFDVSYGAGDTLTLPQDGNIRVTVFEDVNNS